MKQEILDTICEWAVRKSKTGLDYDTFFKLLHDNEDGMKRVMDIWEDEIALGEFPPTEQTLLTYYFNLLDRGIITDDQYSLLIEDIK